MTFFYLQLTEKYVEMLHANWENLIHKNYMEILYLLKLRFSHLDTTFFSLLKHKIAREKRIE